MWTPFEGSWDRVRIQSIDGCSETKYTVKNLDDQDGIFCLED